MDVFFEWSLRCISYIIRKFINFEIIIMNKINESIFNGSIAPQIDNNSTAGAGAASDGDVYQPPPVVAWQPDHFTQQGGYKCIYE